MSSKRIIRDSKFIKAADKDVAGSLAYTIMSSFGVTMDTILTIMSRIQEKEDKEMFNLSIASAVSVRGNISHVNATTIRAAYPELIIDGDRGTGDALNFSALRMVGFGFAALSNTTIASKVSSKAGNAISGGNFPTSVAGKINKEAYESWSQTDKDMFTKTKIPKDWVNSAFSSIDTEAHTFAENMIV
jgi:hypothetical protein